MKMYLLFAGEDYYPNGGAHDLVAVYRLHDDTHILDVGRRAAMQVRRLGFEWFHVYDVAENWIIAGTDEPGWPPKNPRRASPPYANGYIRYEWSAGKVVRASQCTTA